MSFSLLLNSLAVGVAATGLALVAGLTVALAAASARAVTGRLWVMLALVNLALPPFLVANTWLDFTSSWRALSAPGVVAFWSLPVTAAVLASLLWPVVCLLALSAWSRLQPELLEADPQRRGMHLFRGLLLPLAAGELAVASAVVLVMAMANFTVPILFQVRVFTEEFWIRFNTQFDTAGALRATWPLLVLPLLLLTVVAHQKTAWPRLRLPIPPEQLRASLGGLGRVGRWAAWGVLAVSLGLPLGRLLTTGRTWTEFPGALAAGSLALTNSVLTSVIPAVAVVGTGLLLATGVRGAGPRWTWLWFLVPGVFLGVTLIWAFNRPGLTLFYQSLGPVWLALSLRYLAPGWALVASAIRAVDERLVEAAGTLGAGRGRAFRDAVWPQVGRGVASAGYGVFLLCLWDVETVVLIQPPGGETLALRIFNLLHYGHAGQVDALCLLMLLLALAPLAGAALFRQVSRAMSIRSGRRAS